jgi:nitroimidazol reductase NimA-like FMN-containing flavoprotein (pyridoxamine 5'-phosphate oxidase superfamily)/ribosomal protein S18 acetylase RimI-like enzyme
MRKEIYRLDWAQAVALLQRAPVVHLATTTAGGRPLFRTVHGVVVDGALAFHGAPAGEKLDAVGRPAVLAAEEIVAAIPSYFVDPERACPATTYYRSVQLHGVLERVDDDGAKAAVLAELMRRYQPEGGHVPIDAAHPLYRKAVASLLVLRVSLAQLDGKAKLGQNRAPEERAQILERLWARGAPGDARAVDLVRAANPDTPVPPFLASPPGAALACALGAADDERAEGDAAAAAALLDGAYWNAGFDRATLAAAHRGSTAWVGARDAGGALVATARALSDGAKRAWVYDVMVAPAWRRCGLGAAVVRLLLDHPAVRRARTVWLGTRDAQSFYARFGFVARGTAAGAASGASGDAGGAFVSTTMLLDRARAVESGARPIDQVSDGTRSVAAH